MRNISELFKEKFEMFIIVEKIYGSADPHRKWMYFMSTGTTDITFLIRDSLHEET